LFLVLEEIYPLNTVKNGCTIYNVGEFENLLTLFYFKYI